MRKRAFSISYTYQDDVDSFLKHERALHMAITPNWSRFWKNPKYSNVDCVLLLNKALNEGVLHYRNQRDCNLIAARLGNYNLYISDSQHKDQQSYPIINRSYSRSEEDSLEAEPCKQRNLVNRDAQIDDLYKAVDKLKEEILAKEIELANVHLQVEQKEAIFAQELKSSTKQAECELTTQRRITSFMCHYLLPQHLYTLQHLPQMDKIHLLNSLELIDSIAQLPQTASYMANIDSYEKDYSIFRQDFDANNNTSHEIDQQHLDLRDLPSRRSLPISYIDVQSFLQTHLSVIRNDYTFDDDTQVVSLCHNDDGQCIKVSVENTTQAADLHKVIVNHISLIEQQAGSHFGSYEDHDEFSLPAPVLYHKVIQWYIKPVVCGDHFWVMAYYVDVENRQFHRLILDSSVMGMLAKAKALLDMKQSLARSGYELVECKHVFFKDSIGDYQLDSYNSGLYAIRNIKALLDMREKWWDLHSGIPVELDVESITSSTRLIRHAELIYFGMVHEYCSVNSNIIY